MPALPVILLALLIAFCTLGDPPSTPTQAQESGRADFLFADAPATALDREALERAATYSERCSGRALLVLLDGEVVFERYANGWSAGRPHPLASGTKSFAGVLAAAAVADGLIALDEVVSDTLTEWKDDPRKRAITVRQLLDLSSGLAPDSDGLGRPGVGIRDLGPLNDLAGRLRGGARETKPDDRFSAALSVPAIAEPGRVFRYGPTHFYAFGAFLQRKLEQSNRSERTYWQYLDSRVLRPAGLDIGVERFAPDAANQPNLPGGAHLTAGEWARFGEFVRRGGTARSVRSDGVVVCESVIPAECLERCFEPSGANPNYGLTWWLLNGAKGLGSGVADAPARRGLGSRAAREADRIGVVKRPDGSPVRIAMAAGAGKQRLYLLPEERLVVVRFARMDGLGQQFDDAIFLGTLLGLRESPPERLINASP